MRFVRPHHSPTTNCIGDRRFLTRSGPCRDNPRQTPETENIPTERRKMPQLLFLSYFSTTLFFLPLLCLLYVVHHRAAGANTLLHYEPN